jgi:hypothetical protein
MSDKAQCSNLYRVSSRNVKIKGKVKVKVKFILEEITKATRGSTGIALLFP